MNMENMDTILNALVAKLLTDGVASFSQDGLNIKTSYDNGCLSISASFESPVEDNTAVELAANFEKYIRSLSDEFFLEVVESFEDGRLKEIQNKLDSKKLNLVREGIAEFMEKLKTVASEKVKALSTDIAEAKKELSELIDIRDSYAHVLNVTF